MPKLQLYIRIDHDWEFHPVGMAGGACTAVLEIKRRAKKNSPGKGLFLILVLREYFA
ncbi:hypothetical protein D770_25160 [Flammeovirgaceae bacterium 311]|nr:hypothetical protein D770_25160 [Flammeovirgaceae bacterium 311]